MSAYSLTFISTAGSKCFSTIIANRPRPIQFFRQCRPDMKVRLTTIMGDQETFHCKIIFCGSIEPNSVLSISRRVDSRALFVSQILFILYMCERHHPQMAFSLYCALKSTEQAW